MMEECLGLTMAALWKRYLFATFENLTFFARRTLLTR